MAYEDVLAKISADLSNIWGEMTPYILKKQFTEVGGVVHTPSRDQMERVILLLEERALAVALGREMARKRTLQYLRWLKEA